jgi:hypothetical protein
LRDAQADGANASTGNAPDDDRRSALVLQPAAPPSLRTHMRRGARAEKIVIVKPPRLGPDRVADAAPRPHEMVDLDPARAINRRGGVRALAGQIAQYAADSVLGAGADLTAARNQERFSPHR